MHVNMRRLGSSTSNPLQIVGNVSALPIDGHLLAFLSDDGKRIWNKYQPLGVIDAAFAITNESGRWQPELQIQCRDVSLRWERFPYPVRHATGPITLKQGQLEFSLAAMASEQPVQISGRVNQPGPNWSGQMGVSSQAFIPLDAKLIAALRPNYQENIRRFHPQGKVRVNARYHRESASSPIHKKVSVELLDCSIRHELFPYAIQRIHGQLNMENDAWQFNNLEGYNDSARILCQGYSTVDPQGGQNVTTTFHATNVALDDDLRLALKPNAQLLWQRLQPHGILDALAATFQLNTRTRQHQLTFELREDAQSNNRQVQAVHLQPINFPYMIEDIQGDVRYVNHQFQWNDLRGRHATTAFSTQGSARCDANGQWQLDLNRVTADRLKIDNDFIAALPQQYQRQVGDLHWRGDINVLGGIQLRGQVNDAHSWHAGWNLSLDVDQASLGKPDQNPNRSPFLHHVAGTIHLNGSAQPGTVVCQGELEIDSAMLRGVQLTQLRGPLWLDSQRMLLGSWAREAKEGQVARRITAQTLDGEIQADGQVGLASSDQFHFRVNLVNAQANRVLQQIVSRPTAMQGRLNGNLEITGLRSSPHTLQGGGQLQLRDANLYELPTFLALLRTLRSGSVDRTAFNQSDVAFRVKGQDLLLDRIDLVGDGLTLKGVGTLNHNREVDIDFYTIMGRENEYLPAIRPLLGMASQRFLQIHINGPMERPEMTRVVLPGLNATLSQLFPDAVGGNDVARGSKVPSLLRR